MNNSHKPNNYKPNSDKHSNKKLNKELNAYDFVVIPVNLFSNFNILKMYF